MDTIISVSEFSKRHSAFTEPSVRWLIFRSCENGLLESGAIVRLGRRVLIDEELFFEWVKNNGSIHSNSLSKIIA
jgi:hypothetical protein